MKQVIQNFKTGELLVEDVPAPTLAGRGVIVANHASLISAGTEKATVATAQASLLGKARQRPDQVRQVLDFVRKEGLASTWRKVRDKLDQRKPMGYSSAGVVLESNAPAFKPGDRVACAGGGYAVHAETIYVPENLVAVIPENLSFEAAACTTVAAIAMQGVRQADVRLGETCVVIGLGLIGQITAQLLHAAGTRVIGLDLNPDHVRSVLAAGWCVAGGHPDDAAALVAKHTGNMGADAVLITAGTSSNQPVETAIDVTRQRGSVVVVGAVGMNLPRAQFYEKELRFTISCSYGPGRYDPQYEEAGHDYPYGFVRWTENRNMQACLQFMAMGQLDVDPLLTHRFAIADAPAAYDLILGKHASPHLGVLLTYAGDDARQRVQEINANPTPPDGKPGVAFIGAGNFAQTFLLPAVKNQSVRRVTICSATGNSAKATAERFGFDRCATDADAVMADPAVDTLFVATRHHLHGALCAAGLQAKKHVFVEKPLCLNATELAAIEAAHDGSHILQVGFNRRFAPLIREIADFMPKQPLSMTYRVNAGPLPANHWLLDPAQGGGRIRGELCHFLDTLVYLAGAPIRSLAASAIPGLPSAQDAVINVQMANDSVGVILYSAGGDRSLPKEYLEVHGGGCSAVLHDFQSATLHAKGKRRVIKSRGKGHYQEVDAFLNAVAAGHGPPIPFGEICNVTRATFAVETAIGSGQVVQL